MRSIHFLRGLLGVALCALAGIAAPPHALAAGQATASRDVMHTDTLDGLGLFQPPVLQDELFRPARPAVPALDDRDLWPLDEETGAMMALTAHSPGAALPTSVLRRPPSGWPDPATPHEAQIVVSAIPEPATLVLLGLGLPAIAWLVRLRRPCTPAVPA